MDNLAPILFVCCLLCFWTSSPHQFYSLDFLGRWFSAGVPAPDKMAAAAMAEVQARWPDIQCEVCLRTLPKDFFPSSVAASVAHHVRSPTNPRGHTVWSCKECRAQEVAAREDLQSFTSFRHIPENPLSPSTTLQSASRPGETHSHFCYILPVLVALSAGSWITATHGQAA